MIGPTDIVWPPSFNSVFPSVRRWNWLQLLRVPVVRHCNCLKISCNGIRSVDRPLNKPSSTHTFKWLNKMAPASFRMVAVASASNERCRQIKIPHISQILHKIFMQAITIMVEYRMLVFRHWKIRWLLFRMQQQAQRINRLKVSVRN